MDLSDRKGRQKWPGWRWRRPRACVPTPTRTVYPTIGTSAPTPQRGVAVDGNGCPLDTDKDGVPDYRDKCSDTPKGAAVDENGCPLDTDKDGVPDYRDKCSDTPKGVAVDGNGCPLDTDKDGVPDYRDKCPDTPKGVAVDKATGCPLDSDGDGVVDARDQCPGTPKSAKVDAKGCWAVKHILFDIDKTEIKPWSAVELDAVVKVLRANPDLRMEIKGHTDNEGRAAYNQTLSENRAKTVRNYMTLQGIPSGRFFDFGLWILQTGRRQCHARRSFVEQAG